MLEGPDEFISLRRAAELAGISLGTVRVQANAGKLRTRTIGYERLTTRRWLHEYLTAASERDKGRRLPLPEGYVAPE